MAWLAEQSGRDNNEDVPNLHLERANLAGAHLEQANLIGTTLDSKTVLNGATLDTKTRLGDMQWGGVGAVNLTQITWSAVPQLGDEQGVGIRSTDPCPDS
ncbi:MAG TPA: pentapeptide repeat-containing protein [Ktedonobacterales bacterium]|nr:pentapeptide repeat-containing protein [Ktedonobacterales bacterium]